MAFRTTARTLAPLLKSPIAFKHLPPLASSSRTILQSTKTTAPPSLPYARFAARFKSTNTSAPGSTSSVLSTTIAEGESATASSAELEDEASRSTKLNFTDKDGNPLRIEPKLSLTFTCSVDKCGERSTHEFAKRSYERGIVIVQCPGCKNRHLIADHLGWFDESTEQGKQRTIEDLMRAKGKKVTRGRVGQDGDIEIID